MRFSSVRRIARPASTFPTVRDISIVGGGDWVRGVGLIGAVGELLSGVFGCLVFFCEASAACGLWVNRRITCHHSSPRAVPAFSADERRYTVMRRSLL